MGSTKPYVHPHPVAKMFCFRRCTQQHQPSTSASCARTLCWHQKKSESESKFWMGKYPIGHLFLFWDCDSEILFLPVKNHPKKEFRTLSNEEIISSTPNQHLHPGRFWGFFCYESTWWKQAPLGPVDQWYESWSPKTYPVEGFHENIWILFPFIPQTWKEGMRGCGSINLVLFDVLNIHFTADFCLLTHLKTAGGIDWDLLDGANSEKTQCHSAFNWTSQDP